MFDLNQLYTTTTEGNSVPVKASKVDTGKMIITTGQTTGGFFDSGSTSISNTYNSKSTNTSLNGSTITAKKHIIFDAVNFVCSKSTLTAPDIYLPAKDHCTISDDCHLVGTVHYGEAMPII